MLKGSCSLQAQHFLVYSLPVKSETNRPPLVQAGWGQQYEICGLHQGWSSWSRSTWETFLHCSCSMLLVVLLSPHILSRSCLSSLWSESGWRLKGIVNKHLAQADVENEKSRQEMTSMKEAASLWACDEWQPSHGDGFRASGFFLFLWDIHTTCHGIDVEVEEFSQASPDFYRKTEAFLLRHKTSQEFLWWNPSCAGHWRQVFGCGYGPPGPATQHQQSMFQNPSQPTHRPSYA